MYCGLTINNHSPLRWVMFPPGESDAYRAELGLPLRDGELGYDVEFAKRPPTLWWRDVHASLVTSGRAEELGMIEAVQRPGETIFVPRGYVMSSQQHYDTHSHTHTHTHTHTSSHTHTHIHSHIYLLTRSNIHLMPPQVAPCGSQPRLDSSHHSKHDPPRDAPGCPPRHARKVPTIRCAVGTRYSREAPGSMAHVRRWDTGRS